MSLLRTDRDAALRAITIVWVLLVLATCASWLLGVHETGTPGGVHPVNALLLVIAMTKVRFVGAYFMELRAAPLPLRLVFEIWAVGAAATLCALYLLA
jgi:hypothetical protein